MSSRECPLSSVRVSSYWQVVIRDIAYYAREIVLRKGIVGVFYVLLCL